MTLDQALTLGAALIAYSVSAAARIQLPDGRRVTPVAAFGPALVALGPAVYDVAPVWMLIAAVMAVELAVAALHREMGRDLFFQGLLFLASVGIFAGSAALLSGGAFDPSAERGLLLVPLAGSAVAYLAGDLVQRLAGGGRGRLASRLRSGLKASGPLHAVFVSTSALTVLVYGLLGWVTYPILLLLLLATRHEYSRYGEAQVTYEQTVRTLGRLTEKSGYAPEGHHERVAARVRELGHQAGLSDDRIRMLELTALMHRIGAVSLREPGQGSRGDDALVARESASILKATGHLESASEWLLEAASGQEDVSVEARVLRVAERFA